MDATIQSYSIFFVHFYEPLWNSKNSFIDKKYAIIFELFYFFKNEFETFYFTFFEQRNKEQYATINDKIFKFAIRATLIILLEFLQGSKK